MTTNRFILKGRIPIKEDENTYDNVSRLELVLNWWDNLNNIDKTNIWFLYLNNFSKSTSFNGFSNSLFKIKRVYYLIQKNFNNE